MKSFEFILLIAGAILFLFSLVVMIMLIKKGSSFTKTIWFLALSFIMMGFSSIASAEIFGVIKYEKEKEFKKLETLVEALETCPGNEGIVEVVKETVEVIEASDEEATIEENIILANANLILGRETKTLEYTTKVLEEDSTNQKAKVVKEMAEIEGIIKELPIKEGTQKEIPDPVKKRIRKLELDTTVTKVQKKKLKGYQYNKLAPIKNGAKNNNKSN